MGEMTYPNDDAVRKQSFEWNSHFLSFAQGDIAEVRSGKLDGWMDGWCGERRVSGRVIMYTEVNDVRG